MNRVDTFRALHVPGDPLVLFNIWDAGTARVVAEAGAQAIATGSYGVAESLGFADGETVPFELVLANLRRICSVTDLPVTVDLESGYGATPADVQRSVDAARDAGAAGINMEDRMPGESALVPIDDQAERLSAAASSGLFVNARCDVFRGGDVAADGEKLVTATLERARAYADAGAGGLFVPFLADHGCIAAICEGSPLPVNVLWSPGCGPRATLAALGVARISHGHQPWAAAMDIMKREAASVFAGGVPAYAAG
ncbi:isocitrate lyase/phosphoenolpyruvate mutase family protein [Altererythrobacter aerius]|uniref:Isocitrate lyase/phosphoenolpyruvate mutase family protein n=1 Tax=Tsuneonella aeria TaxID=1837929 RepID=A0A6I4TAW1_9SPHN|nr:isocitrate lyase/phosphoenolpyruvate mutase family protein [Tsuneonella aeria]MXO74461.1 isocitrate lyase/phosphoenolpyruvate mutase family protein [Tsuneonella aeria]